MNAVPRALTILIVLMCLPVPALPPSGVDANPVVPSPGGNDIDIPAGRDAGDSTSCGYSAHDEIYINGNDNFTEAKGVTGGFGTQADPYIISGWNIRPHYFPGIYIRDTDAFFVIRDVIITFGVDDQYGISLEEVSNGIIEKSDIHDNRWNIALWGCSNIQISDNDLVSGTEDYYEGSIYVSDSYPYPSSNIVITRNRIGGGYEGIRILGADVTVTDNEILEALYGVRLGSSSSTVRGNRIHSCDLGILSGSSQSTRILDNEIRDVKWGIVVYYAEGGEMAGNTLHYCSEWGIQVFNTVMMNISRCRLSNILRHGILLSSAGHTTIDNCTMSGCGMAVEGDYGTVTVTSTTVDEKPVYYLKSARDGTVPADAGQIFLIGCTNLTVRDFNCQAVPEALFLASSRDVRVESAHFTNVDYGAYLYWATNVSLNNSRIDADTCLYQYYSTVIVANTSLSSTDTGNDLFLSGQSIADLINTSSVNSKINITSKDAFCRIFWLATVSLKDTESGRGVPNGSLRIENYTRAEVFNASCDSSGFIRDIQLLDCNITANSIISSKRYKLFASAPYHTDNSTGSFLFVNRSFTYIFTLTELTSPWSRLDPVPVYWNTTEPLPLHFSAGDNGSGLDYVELYTNAGGRWELFSNATGVSRFRQSPILFDNFSTEMDYGFYLVAYDNSTHVQEPPYDIVVTKLDITDPEFTITPIHGARNAAINTSVAIEFMEPVILSSVKMEIKPGAWTPRWSSDGLTLTFNPYGELEYFTTYTVEVISGIDLAGNSLAPRTTTFMTTTKPAPDLSQPTVVGINPPAESVLAPGPVVITFDFSEPMNWTSVSGALKVNGRPAPAGSGNGTGYTFTLIAEVGEYYTLILDTTASDVAGNGLQSTFITAFTCSVPGVPLGSISGQVVAENSAGLSGVNVTVGRRQLVTDVNGLFNASRLAAGDYLLTASGYLGYFPYDASFSLSPGENLTVTIVLRAMNGTLGGYIRIGDGQPVAGASVTIYSDGERVARVLSDRTGRFTVVVRPGTYTLKVTAEGFEDVVLEDRVVLPGQAVETEQIVLAYRAREPGSSVIPATIMTILGTVALALFMRGKLQRTKAP